jgi:hypothetical protein
MITNRVNKIWAIIAMTLLGTGIVIVYLLLRGGTPSASYVPLDTDHSQNFFLTNMKQDANDPAANDIPLPNVSMAKVQDGYYAIASYGYIVLLNRQSKQYCIVDMGTESQNPTDLYSNGDGTLFVANYHRNNILYGNIDIESCKYNIEKIYQTKSLISPEQVYSDGKVLLSANFDGNNVTAIDLNSGDELWTTKVTSAHGLTIVRDKVYASSLWDRKIFEMDINNGNILRSYGTEGSNTAKGQLLWPITIYPIDNDNLVICDSHTGHISFFNIKNFNISKYTGGNGPTFKFFNYPYAATLIDNELFVLSTFKGNILVIDHDTMQVKETWHFGKPKWDYDLTIEESKYPMIKKWNDYVDIDTMKHPLKIGEHQYYLAYARLRPIIKKACPTLTLTEVNTTFIDSYLYIPQNLNLQDEWNLVLSSSTNSAFAISRHLASQTPIILPYNLKFKDVWVNKNELVSPYGILDKDLIAKQLNLSKEKILDLYNSIGYIPLQELVWILSQTGSYPLNEIDKVTDQDKQKLRLSFSTIAGQEFFDNYKQCNKISCDKQYLQNLALSYYKTAYGYKNVPLSEWLLVAMIANIPIPEDERLIGKFWRLVEKFV